MDKLIIIIAAFASLLLALRDGNKKAAKVAVGTISQETETLTGEVIDIELEDLYRAEGAATGIDWKLLKAIAIVESSENPNAVNPADPSVGLMQILCQPDGKGGCKNKFFIDGWPVANREALFDPVLNVHLGAQILKWNIDTYGFRRGIAVYNAWGARNDPENGPFRNQGYVDKVTKELAGLRVVRFI